MSLIFISEDFIIYGVGLSSGGFPISGKITGNIVKRKTKIAGIFNIHLMYIVSSTYIVRVSI